MTIGGIVKVEKLKQPCNNYEEPKLRFVIFEKDIVTLSGGEFDEGNMGSDLGGGQVGGEDIFN